MTNVYYEVGNTLELTFITGIQRVTREFSKQVLIANGITFNHTYIPVLYDHRKQSWRHLSKLERTKLLGNTARSKNIINRAFNKLLSYAPKPKSVYIQHFEEGSFFFDIESSWHSKIQRRKLLPLLKKSKVRIIKLHYDIIPLLFPQTSHPNTIKLFKTHLTSHLENSELFICISKRSKLDIEKYSNNNSQRLPKLATIELGSNIKPTTREINSQRKTLVRSQYGRYLLSVGTVEPRKNYLMLLKAFDAIHRETDLNLVIVGRPGWLSEDIMEAINSHPQAGKRLFYKQNAGDNELATLYDQAWLNIVPSVYEGFGLPVVESLSRSCPTICSNAGSLPEVGGNNVILFSHDKPNELYELTLSLVKDNKKYQNLRAKARKYQPLTWQTTAKQIDQCITSSQ